MKLYIGLIFLSLFSITSFAENTSTEVSKEKAQDVTETQTEQPTDVVDATTQVQSSENKAEFTVSEPAQTSSKKYKNVEKLEVTGSYIKRIDLEGPSPVVTIDKEDFQKAGVNTVSDYLRESPLFESSTGNGNKEGQFRFHGQHAGNTLILLNGLRMPKIGAAGRDFFNGVRGIPTNVIDRVEVLKDGSSALYGSDAMAGVVNFITQKDYDGAEFSTKFDVAEIGVGVEQNHSLTYGQNYSRGNWFASVQYVKQGDYDQEDVGNYHTGETAPNLLSSTEVRQNGDGGGVEKFNAPCNPGVSRCRLDTRSIDRIRDKKENVGAILTGRFDISDDLNVAVLGMYNRRTNLRVGRPNFINFNENEGGSIRSSDIGSSGLQQAANGFDTVDISTQPFEEVGLERVRMTEDAFNFQTKVEGYMGDTWSWNVVGSHAFMTETNEYMNGLIDKGIARNLISKGAWDPTAVGQNSGALDAAQVQATEAYDSTMSSARFLATGEIFDFQNLWGAGGAFAVALGVESQWESSADASDQAFYNRELTQVLAPAQKGSRQVQSAFLELSSNPLDSVELQLAGRYDSYSDFGDTINPKVSLGYRPSKKALIRGSWGTNFHAPSVRNMIFQESVGYEQFVDDSRCRTTGECDEEYYQFTRYRDPNIGAETGVNYNLGTVVQPNKNWTFTIDQWNFEGKDTIAKLFGYQYSDYARQIGEDGLSEIGVDITRGADGTITSVRAPEVINLGERTIRGLDMNVKYDNKVKLFGKVMTFGANFDHTHFLVYKTKRISAIPIEHRDDLNWKNTSSVSLSTKDHNYRFAARTVAGRTNDRTATPTHTEYDLGYRYSLSWGGRLTMGAKNILNSRPPTNRNTSFINFSSTNSAFQALGRRYYVGYSQSF